MRHNAAAADAAENILRIATHTLCKEEGINDTSMHPLQRMFLTHYRCTVCKSLLPIYHLDLSHIKKVRCGLCGQLIHFKSSGKYGRLRKKLASRVWLERSNKPEA